MKHRQIYVKIVRLSVSHQLRYLKGLATSSELRFNNWTSYFFSPAPFSLPFVSWDSFLQWLCRDYMWFWVSSSSGSVLLVQLLWCCWFFHSFFDGVDSLILYVARNVDMALLLPVNVERKIILMVDSMVTLLWSFKSSYIYFTCFVGQNILFLLLVIVR